MFYRDEMPAEQASRNIDINQFQREHTRPGGMSLSTSFNGHFMTIKADEDVASMEETRAKLFTNFAHQSNQVNSSNLK